MKSANQRIKTLSLFKRRHADYQSRFQALANLAALGFFIYFLWLSSLELIAIFGFPLTNVGMPQQVWCLLPMSTSSLIECTFCSY